MDKPQKWTDAYPYGTKEGDEESKVFRVLARGSHDFQSTSHITKASGLTRQRVEEIIDKYVNKVKPSLIIPNIENDESWAYWERVPDLLRKDERNISQKDMDKRIDRQLLKKDTTCDQIITDNIEAWSMDL